MCFICDIMEIIYINTSLKLNNVYFMSYNVIMHLPKNINSKRLLLKQINHDDFEVFVGIINEPDVALNLKFILKMFPHNKAQQIFKIIMDSYKTFNPIILLIIKNKENGNDIGLCGLVLSEDSYKAKCFYALLPKYRGYGFAIEAMKKLIEYAFEEPYLEQIIAFIDPTNSKGWKVAERVGMKYLGQMTPKNKPSKMMYFSIDKAEFEAQGDY